MLRFIDSCGDHYATGDIAEKYQQNNNAVVLPGIGRRGTAGLRINGSLSYVSLTLDSQTRWIVGCALRYDGLVNINPPTVLDFANAGTRQLNLAITDEGFLRVSRGGVSGQTLGTSVQALHTGIYYYIETNVLFDLAAGEVLVRVDGVEWLLLTGIQTQQTAGILPNQIRFGTTGNNGISQLDLDDLYICDGQGSGTFTTFLGDCRVDALFDNADGTYTDYTPSSGTVHYLMVDEPAPNDDTDYVSATTAGARDSYHLQTLPPMPNPTVLAVQACVSARKEDVDEIVLHTLLVSNGITSVGAGTHALTSSYLYALDLWTLDPGTGLSWTEAAVNQLQVGVERQ